MSESPCQPLSTYVQLPLAERLATGRKRCPQCGEIKTMSEGFYRHKSTVDQATAWCKECFRARKDTQQAAECLATGRKRCIKCGEVKELAEFHRHRSSRDGRKSYCGSCSNAMNRERRPYRATIQENELAGMSPAARSRLDAARREAEAFERGERPYRLRSTGIVLERYCCHDPGDGSHDRGCPFARRAG